MQGTFGKYGWNYSTEFQLDGATVIGPDGNTVNVAGEGYTDPHEGQQGKDSEGDGTPDSYSGERVENDTGVEFANREDPTLTIERAESDLSGNIHIPNGVMEGDDVTITGHLWNVGDEPIEGTVKLTWKKNNRGVDLTEKDISFGPNGSTKITADLKDVPAIEHGRKVWLLAEAGQPTSTVEIAQTVLEVRPKLDSHPLADSSSGGSTDSTGSTGSTDASGTSDTTGSTDTSGTTNSTDATNANNNTMNGQNLLERLRKSPDLDSQAMQGTFSRYGWDNSTEFRLDGATVIGPDGNTVNVAASTDSDGSGSNDSTNSDTSDSSGLSDGDTSDSTDSDSAPDAEGQIREIAPYAAMAAGAVAVVYGVSKR